MAISSCPTDGLTDPLLPSQALSASDSLMWRIERDPILRSPVVVVALLDRSPRMDGIHRTFDQICRVLPRLRCRIEPPSLRHRRPRWVADPGFDLTFHIRHQLIDEPADLEAVLAVAGPMAVEAFDLARPPWQLRVVDGLAGGQAALILRFHHTLTDGVGGIAVAGAAFDVTRTIPRAEATIAPAAADTPAGVSNVEAVLRSVTRAVSFGASAARHPAGAGRDAVRLAASIGRLLAPASAPCSPLLIGRSLNRHLDAFDFDLVAMREAAHTAGATLNDALLAGVVGGLAHYHTARGVPLDEVRVTMPVSLREPGDPPGGNQFAPARFELPAGISDPAERMAAVGAIARAWRAEPSLVLTDTLAAVLDALPAPVVSRVFGEMLKHVDVDVSNVPGIEGDAFIGGARIDRMWGFAPPTGAALSVTLLSHIDRSCVGLELDDAAVDDPTLMGRCMRTGFSEILTLTAEAAKRERQVG